MALTADIKIIRYGVPGNSTQPGNLPMGSGVPTPIVCYRGSFALTDLNGFIKSAASPLATDTCWGLIENGGPGFANVAPGITNSGASSNVTVDIVTGSFWMAASTGADAITEASVGKTVYVFDEKTVAATSNGSTRPVAGIVIKASDPLNVLSGLVAVKVGPVAGGTGAPS